MVYFTVSRLYKAVIDNVEGYLVEVVYALTFHRDSILPPFTSRTMRSVMFKSPCLRGVADLYSSTRSIKPVTIRVLRSSSGPLYKLKKGGRELKPYMVKSGDTLYGAISFYKRNFDEQIYDALSCSGAVDIEYAKLHLEVVEANVYSMENLSLGIESSFRIDFITPLIITTKTMTPPSIRNTRVGKVIKKSKQAYRLFPTPGYILSQAMRQWLSIVHGIDPNNSWYPYSIGRLGDLLMVEVDYNVNPVTALYGRSSKGLILVRGFRGYTIYTILNRIITGAVDRLLAFSSIIGLGKSRSIGFGEIRVRPVEWRV